MLSNEAYEDLEDIFDRIAILRDELTDEQFAFCEVYLENLTSPAYISVAKALPYEENPNRKGRDLLMDTRVIEYLDLRRKIIRRFTVTKDEVLIKLNDLITKCMAPVQVLDNKGHPTGEYTFDSRGATKGMELLSKYLGLDNTKQIGSLEAIASVPKVSVNKDDLDKFIMDFNEHY